MADEQKLGSEGKPLYSLLGADEDFNYDEQGGLSADLTAEDLVADGGLAADIPRTSANLNGSWLLRFPGLRGPLRLEAEGGRLRLSGDIYAAPAAAAGENFPPGSLTIGKNWYPAFSKDDYRWYFRSTLVRSFTHFRGIIGARVERKLWNKTQEEFTTTDTGVFYLFFGFGRPLLDPALPQKTIQVPVKFIFGGNQIMGTAIKTSPYYRGCKVEVDVMKNRSWPASASSCDGQQTFSFTSVYRDGGFDFLTHISETDVPEDSDLTNAELDTLLSTHRAPTTTPDAWRLWLLVGSRQGGTFGIMFDSTLPPFREGAVGFFDPTLPVHPIIEPSAQGKKLGDVPAAFLRTLIHEAGHAFNLFHPKHDIHGVPKGTTIMNQTGDVMGFASPANPYPCNATFGFNDHNRTSLMHSPDPQVKPGWKQFGWGHGSSNGVAEPTDVGGLHADDRRAEGLELKLEVSEDVHRGEFVLGTVTLENTGPSPRMVTTALNLSEGDLRMLVTSPSGDHAQVHDVVLACSDRKLAELKPGASISGHVQLFYTNKGHTFDQPGRYQVRAELDVGDGTIAVSNTAEVVVRSAVREEERGLQQLTMDHAVGRSLALGDYGPDEDAGDKVSRCMDKFGNTVTGAACAMVMANSLGRSFRATRQARVLRKPSKTKADKALEVAVKGKDATLVAKLAAAVVSPTDTSLPLLDQIGKLLKQPPRGRFKKADLDQAKRIIADLI